MNPVTIKFNLNELNNHGRDLLTAVTQQSAHLAAILAPRGGIIYAEIYDRRDSDDVVRVRVESSLTWAERARKHGVEGLDGSQVARDESGAPIRRGSAWLPTDEHIESVERFFEGMLDNQTTWFEVPSTTVSAVRSGKMEGAEAWNAIGAALADYCQEGDFVIWQNPHWVTQQEAATRVGVKPTTIYGAVQRGKLRTMTDPTAANPQRGGTLVWWPDVQKEYHHD